MMRNILSIIANLLPGKRSNWKVVVLCMIVATTFWFFNALNKDNYLTRINFPIELQYNDSLYVAVKPLATQVRIEVNGGGWSLLRKSLGIDLSPMPIYLENPAETRFIVPTNLSTLISERLSSDTRLVSVLSDTLFLNIERYQTRKLLLEVDTLTLSLAQNFRIKGPIIIQPDSITVTGPQSFVNALPESLFIEIPEKNISSLFSSDVSVGSLGSSLYNLEPDVVNVQFDVVEFVEAEREVELSLFNFPESPKVFPEQTKVKVKFLVIKDSLASSMMYPWQLGLDYNRRNRNDSVTKPYLINYPSFVRELRIEPFSIPIINERDEP